MDQVLEALRRATEGSRYEGGLFLVGGIVRDKCLKLEPGEDIDIVLEGDAGELATYLRDKGITEHDPVTYPRFGTAMITISGRQVEIVGARSESYERESRKPSTRPGTLLDDVLRRDFTINTLLENLHTGEVRDMTGLARQDMEAGIIRTPQDPRLTFDDDPLRMLRAVRFAARFGFVIHPDAYSAMSEMAARLAIISGERIRDEFVKILMSPNATWALETLRETGLLDQFAPELVTMHGVTQNIYHIYDVWTHSMKTLESIPVEWGIILRLSALFHDVGKVETRSVDANGQVHFYNHQNVSARMARRVMRRLRFPNSDVDRVTFLISMHLRVGEYDDQWTDAAVRRLVRDAGDRLEDAIRLTQADKAAANPAMPSVDLQALREHIDRVTSDLAGRRIASPLSGREIMSLLGMEAGPEVGKVKAFLENEVVEGRLAPEDKNAAREIVRKAFDA